jgi:putative hemolysin
MPFCVECDILIHMLKILSFHLKGVLTVMNAESFNLILVLGALILMSAYFSATETAFSAINRIRLKSMAGNGDNRAALVLKLVSNYDKVLSTILIGNNIVNIALASLSTVIFVRYFGNAGVTISAIVMTVLVLIFGEITPKSLAKEAPESFAMSAAPLLRLLIIMLAPLNYFFTLWKVVLTKVVKLKKSRGITEEELITMVNEAARDGEIEKQEGELIRNAIEFNDLTVSDVLTPRIDMTAVFENDSIKRIQHLFAESGYSRLPVYRDSLDNIVGVIHLKDFFRRTSDDPSTFVKPVLHTTEKERISRLLRLLQEKKCHLAVVTDEHGGTMGIVTLEDIVEEIVGEIWDEHDEIIREFEQTEENEFLANGSASIEKFFRLLDKDQDCDVATVNGWVIKQLGRWPAIGDVFEYENLLVEVIEIEDLMAKSIKVTVNEDIRDNSF